MLRNQVALITGAARGMGREIALTYAREGTAVGLLDIEVEELDQVVLDIHKEGGTALGRVADVRDSARVESAVQAVVQHLGPMTS
jgi:3-oxoacyl-[acyl-carrier protein] reductase